MSIFIDCVFHGHSATNLLPIAREHDYHPDMRGSWPIKAVLPTIAPDLAYDNMEVANGGMAQEAFAEIMQPETSPERSQKLHDALLYCERDTLAMVRIAHYFFRVNLERENSKR